MSEPMITSGPAAEPTSLTTRRWLLRGGAVAAGAAVVAAAAPRAAHAADGDNLVIGDDNIAESTTTLTVGGDTGTTNPTLALENADGPSLRLQSLPNNWAGNLEIGEIAGTELGPVLGVETADGPVTTYLVTGADLANVPTPFPITPSRVLDTRTVAGQRSIVRKSAGNAITAEGRLRAGQWIDVATVFTGVDYSLEAIFANLTVTRPVAGGYAVLYPPGTRPLTSTLNFTAGQTLANAAFVGTGTVGADQDEYHVVRLYSATDAAFLLDVTGGVTQGNVQTPLGQAARAAGGRRALISKLRRAFARSAR